MITKTYLYTQSVGGFYQYKIYKIVDAIGQIFYMATPVSHVATVLADNIDDIKPKLEKQVPILNEFLAKVR